MTGALRTIAAVVLLTEVMRMPGNGAQIRVYHSLGGREGEALTHKLVAAFAAGNPDLVVEARHLSASEIEALLQHPSASPATGGARATFVVDNAVNLIPGAARGALAPLTHLVDEAVWQDHYDKVLQTLCYSGDLWGIPLEANPYAIYCNLDLFKAGGIAKLPETWEEVLEDARKLTRDTDGDGKPDVFGYTQCSFQFPLLLWAYGVDWLRKDGSIGFADPPAAEILHGYWELRSYSPPHVDFERGDVAMKISVSDNLERYRHINFTVIPLPRGTQRANALGGSDGTLALSLLANSDPALAKRFLAFWCERDNYLLWCTETYNLPLRKSVRESEKYRAYLDAHPHMKVFNAELDYARPRPAIPEYGPIHWLLNEAVNWAAHCPTQPSVAECQAKLDEVAGRAGQVLRARGEA